MRGLRLLSHALVVLALGACAAGCSDDDKGGGSSTPTSGGSGGTGGTASGSTGSAFWFEGNTVGNALKTHTSAEANYAAQVLVLVNQERAAAGVPALTLDAEAEAAALAHSHDMFGRGFFSHTTPEGWDPSDRLVLVGASGYSAVGENIAQGQPDADAVMTAWMNSAGHRANILSATFTHIGIGVVEGPPITWTQVFLRRP